MNDTEVAASEWMPLVAVQGRLWRLAYKRGRERQQTFRFTDPMMQPYVICRAAIEVIVRVVQRNPPSLISRPSSD